ncbi:hypothetical protein M407DRAFT_65655 [Tulasnella calospora MUT 4182]|uniref:Core domain-containing protein n=1 Tax=Tulasnella calospora MUT 4182 TaxID=1051891 RepID=A0A0C3QV23_9AGAM|nr:hypothetical protein M407DRAFT_65655 [Tulasnella calospora MUT 4182]
MASAPRFASTSASPTLPEDAVPRSTLVSAPTKEELEREEVDVDWELLKDPSIRITERAAEQLRNIAMRDKDPDVALRVAVESGGCHGYQYKIELTSVKDSSGEFHFEHPTRHPSHVVVDPVSLTLVNGAIIDFAQELIGSSFMIVENPQAVGGCGCGVSWEAKF